MLIIKPNLNKIKSIFRSAEEIWVATALLNNNGLNQILHAAPKKCIKHFLIGTWLPTQFEALHRLFMLKKPDRFTVRVFKVAQFHPKVYIAKNKSKYIAIIGSSNTTLGGLNSNTEVNVLIKDVKIIKELIEWFGKEEKNGLELNREFIKYFKVLAQKRKKVKKINDKNQKQFDRKISDLEVEKLELRKSLINKVRNWKKSKKYKIDLAKRKDTIKQIRSSLNYPYFNNINYDKFFKIRELGSILGFNQFRILENKRKFKSQLKYLINETKPIEDRINNTCNKSGEFYTFGVRKGLVTKVLNMHKPKLYPVWNNASHNTLNHYGMSFNWGLNRGEKYRLICNTLKEIESKIKIENLSVLDKFLFDYFDKKRNI